MLNLILPIQQFLTPVTFSSTSYFGKIVGDDDCILGVPNPVLHGLVENDVIADATEHSFSGAADAEAVASCLEVLLQVTHCAASNKHAMQTQKIAGARKMAAVADWNSLLCRQIKSRPTFVAEEKKKKTKTKKKVV